MTTTTQTHELAYQGAHGEWILLGDYPSEEAALEAAREWAADPNAGIHCDDSGTAVFGISGDPASGHYETRVEVYEDGDFLTS